MSAGTATPGSSSDRATSSAISHLTRNGSVKRSVRKPNPGMTAVTPKSADLYSRNWTSRTSPGSAPATSTGPASGCARPRSSVAQSHGCSRGSSCPDETVLDLEGQLLAWRNSERRRDTRMPAVVRHRSSPTRAAVRVHVATSRRTTSEARRDGAARGSPRAARRRRPASRSARRARRRSRASGGTQARRTRFDSRSGRPGIPAAARAPRAGRGDRPFVRRASRRHPRRALHG